MATIGELIGVQPFIWRRWVTVTAGDLVVGDVTRTAAWARTVAAIYRRDGRVHIRYEDGSKSSPRSSAYMTVDAPPVRKNRRRQRKRT